MADQHSVTGDTPVPVLVHQGVHLSSAFDPVREAAVQASVVENDANEVWVYGVGSGHLADQLLQRPALKSLYLVFFNHQLLAESLAVYSHDWIEDPRVRLVFAGHLKQISRPRAVIYAELMLAEPDAVSLRDRVVMALDNRLVSMRLDKRQAQYDRPNILQNLPMALNDPGVDQFFDQHKGGVITVIAGGPSATAFLSNPEPSDCLIVVSTALRAVLQAGLQPDIVVALDGHPGMVGHFEGVAHLPALHRSTLVYAPAIPPAMLALWLGPRSVFRLDTPLYQGVSECKALTALFCSGTVTHSAIDLAVQMGAREVRLVGADFGFPDGYTHVEHASKRRKANGQVEIENGHGDLIESKPALVAYLRDLESYIALYPKVRFVSMSPEGARIDGAIQFNGGGSE
ncbi:motility associated factor glycosyltransferase family protein [Nitrincola alkalilacustris]|uniref:motility associated factor glycosyltransferase family protein n=1 Tax=Nitrincola alkalilacustris TaxID=1571224 RepID=UPI0014578124|nr:6-hydroxymethylpterin diphosphokinase MptE-like protein [Nitrincola alkalilacustris]